MASSLPEAMRIRIQVFSFWDFGSWWWSFSLFSVGREGYKPVSYGAQWIDQFERNKWIRKTGFGKCVPTIQDCFEKPGEPPLQPVTYTEFDLTPTTMYLETAGKCCIFAKVVPECELDLKSQQKRFDKFSSAGQENWIRNATFNCAWLKKHNGYNSWSKAFEFNARTFFDILLSLPSVVGIKSSAEL